jgi:hypothetical protein
MPLLNIEKNTEKLDKMVGIGRWGSVGRGGAVRWWSVVVRVSDRFETFIPSLESSAL